MPPRMSPTPPACTTSLPSRPLTRVGPRCLPKALLVHGVWWLGSGVGHAWMAQQGGSVTRCVVMTGAGGLLWTWGAHRQRSV